MAVTKTRGNDVSANGASIASLTALLNTASVSLPVGQINTKYGAVLVNSAGELEFVPGTLAVRLGAGKKATETVKLSVETASGSIEQVQVTYSILGENDAPIAAADSLLLVNGKAKSLNILKNDFDIDTGDRLKISSLDNGDAPVSLVRGGFSTATAHGVLTVSASGVVKFVVAAGFANSAFTDTVSYEVSDGKGGFDIATLDIVNNGGNAVARPGRLDLDPVHDTGVSATDNITNSAVVTISGAAQPGQTVSLFNNDNFVIDVVAIANGRFSYDQFVLSAGTNRITAKVTDLAGVELISAPLVVTRDTTLPSAPINLALAEADDTGSSSTDGFTSKTSGLTMTGVTEPNTKVSIFEGNVLLASAISDATGAFAVDISLSVGTHVLTARAIDDAGNLSDISEERSITVVTPPSLDFKPVIAEVVPSGAASNDVSPTLQISLTRDLPAGASIEVYDANLLLGVITGSGSNFSFTPAVELLEGMHSFTARVIDVAGGRGPLSNVRTLEIDTTAPGAPGSLDLAALDDSGRSNTDNVTSVVDSLTVTATIAPGTRADAVTLYEWNDSDGNSLVEADELSVIELASASVNGTTFRADVRPGELVDGAHKLFLTQKDKAGNESLPDPINVLALVIDTTAPIAPSDLDLAMDDDTGSLRTDNLTFNSQEMTISGKAEALSQVELYRQVGSSNQVSLGKVIATELGAFTLDINLPEGVSGEYTIFARATDVAGNVSAISVPLSIKIDAEAPKAPVFSLLAVDDHTGRLKDNENTSLTSELTFSGITDADSTVEVFKSEAGGLFSLGQAVVTGEAFSIELSLDEGDYRLVAKATDKAGNVSALGPIFKVKVDTTAPNAIPMLNLLNVDDTGVSATDNITFRSDDLTLTAVVAAGTEREDVFFYEWNDVNENGVIDVSVAGEISGPLAVTDAVVNGTSYVANFDLAEGLHQLVALQKDAAGNASILDASNVFRLLIDNTAPQDDQGQDLEVFFESATELNNDQIEITGRVSGAVDSGEVLKIYNGNTLLGQAVIAEDNTWSFMLNKLSVVRSYTLSGQFEDVAGNTTIKIPLARVTLGTDSDDEIVATGTGTQYIFAFDGNDTVVGGSGRDFIYGDAGNDRIKGADGGDKLFGGAGNDIIEGEEGDDLIAAGDGSDILRGGNGEDILIGDAGSDRLIGGLGSDFLYGGTGADTFTGGDGTLNDADKPVSDGSQDTYLILEGDSNLPPASTDYKAVTPLVDQITDYFTGTDLIDLGGLRVDPEAASSNGSYADALADAIDDLSLGADSSFQYLTTTVPGNGAILFGTPSTTQELGVSYLFVNASGDTAPDQVIQITGIVGANGLGSYY